MLTTTTAARVAFIEQALADGRTPLSIAAELNMSPRRIWRWLMQSDRPHRPNRPDLAERFHTPRGRTDGRLEEVEFLLDAGESTWQICRTLDVLPAVMSVWLWNRGRPDLARRFEQWVDAA